VIAKDNFFRVLADVQPVEAAFPGTNSRIVFERNPDGYRVPETRRSIP
jgi:hypothetical protein